MGKNNAPIHSQHTHLRYRRKDSTVSTQSMDKTVIKQPEFEIPIPTSPNNQLSEEKRTGNTLKHPKSNTRKRRRRKVHVPSTEDNQKEGESVQTQLLKDTLKPYVHYSNQRDAPKTHAPKKGQIRKKSSAYETQYKPISVIVHSESTGEAKKEIIDQLLTKTEDLSIQNAYSDEVISPVGSVSAVDDEELAYTVEQRRTRKSMQTQFQLQCTDTKAYGLCEWPTGTSSQDTQSASEDEGSFVPVMEDARAREEYALEKSCYDFFPNTFPREKFLMCSSDAIGEICIVEFEFQPHYLRVRPGQVVVLKISAETMGMVEHCLDVTFTPRDTSQVVRASSAVLRASEFVAWRFGKVGRVDIECSVYHTRGTIEVADHVTKNAGGMLPNRLQEIRPPVPVMSYKNEVKRVVSSADQIPMERTVSSAVKSDVLDEDNRVFDKDHNTSIFHPPHNLRQALDEDVEVCREVLCQYDRINASSVIIGQVACPLAEYNVSHITSRDCNGKASSTFQFQEHYDQVAEKERDLMECEAESDATAIYNFFKQRKSIIRFV
uniref:AlNc14C398G11343 protein n=1 Tax=Albugo laibachii Nc14 TaxID=890382 RepID=F0WYT3_9STRA|nr:AlNc14C398G11343 [Albugo laibachii Nc14]|eukprot:CCA26642.1 AlNc14C398G11343 [Albugo laibachii Nc14]